MALIILRCVFIVFSVGLGLFLFTWEDLTKGSPWIAWGVFGGVTLLALGVVAVDILFRRKKLDIISAVYFGLIVGLFLAYVGGLALTPSALAMERIFE